MVRPKRIGRLRVLLKCQALIILCLSFIGLLSCADSGTKSFAGSSGTSGTSTGWTVTVSTFGSSVSTSKGETAMVVVKIRDATGSPAPEGTRLCLSVSFGTIFVDEVKEEAVRTGCHETSNNRGEAMGTYVPPSFTGTDHIQAAAMGAIGSTTIEVLP